MNQATMARALGISPSYLNQLEHGSRPLTVSVLLRITEVFGVDAGFFAGHEPARLVAELHEAFSDLPGEFRAPTEEIDRLARELPSAAASVVTLYRRYRQVVGQLAAETRTVGDGIDAVRPLLPHEEVTEFFYRRQNYVGELDGAGEDLATRIGVRPGETRRVLAARLQDSHGVRIATLTEELDPVAGALHDYDPTERVLRLSPQLRPGQLAFRMATQLAYLEHDDLLESLASADGPTDPTTHTLTRIGLGHYFAAALLLPYTVFHRTAEEFRYDVERLTDHFALGFETVAHRLSTLQRPSAPGVPLSFVRVDRAGNMSKRQSATGFHLSRGGGTCPLWNVYQAFSSPGTVHTQIAAIPDGRRYLWIARTVTRSRGRWGAPGKTFAIGLGCDIRHAARLVYSTGLDLDDPAAAIPIGSGCRVCERAECPQRAFPPAGQALAIREERGTFVPYPVAHD